MFFIGALANLWTGIEELIDLWVEDIHERGGDKLIQSRLPPNLDRELDYLTAALKVGLVYERNRDEAARIIERLHQIKGFRHTLIHGAIVDVAEGMKVIVDHSRVRGSRRVRARVTFAHAQLIRHYESAFHLEADLRKLLTGKDALKTSG